MANTLGFLKNATIIMENSTVLDRIYEQAEDAISDPALAAAFRSRYPELERLWEQLDEAHTDICAQLYGAEGLEEQELRAEYDDLYVETESTYYNIQVAYMQIWPEGPTTAKDPPRAITVEVEATRSGATTVAGGNTPPMKAESVARPCPRDGQKSREAEGRRAIFGMKLKEGREETVPKQDPRIGRLDDKYARECQPVVGSSRCDRKRHTLRTITEERGGTHYAPPPRRKRRRGRKTQRAAPTTPYCQLGRRGYGIGSSCTGRMRIILRYTRNPDVCRYYDCIYVLLRKCILTRTQPHIEGPLGQPPFERPSIAKAITNFVLFKFNQLAQREWQAMYDLAKMFLHCFNHWNFETPSARKLQVSSPEDISAYQINYTRWLVFCHVPAFCDSLPHFETTLVFGRTLLRAVFKSVCHGQVSPGAGQNAT